jgi:hypothetical protein
MSVIHHKLEHRVCAFRSLPPSLIQRIAIIHGGRQERAPVERPVSERVKFPLGWSGFSPFREMYTHQFLSSGWETFFPHSKRSHLSLPDTVRNSFAVPASQKICWERRVCSRLLQVKFPCASRETGRNCGVWPRKEGWVRGMRVLCNCGCCSNQFKALF